MSTMNNDPRIDAGNNDSSMMKLASSTVNRSEELVFCNKEKKRKGIVVTVVVLVLIAILGIGFGIWAFLSWNQDKDSLSQRIKELEEKERIIIEDTEDSGLPIDNDPALLQSLIMPYSVTLGGSSNTVFEYDFDDNVKAAITYYNLSPRNTEDFVGGEKVFFGDLNSEFKKLFGTDKSLEEKSYSLSHGVSLEYNAENGKYTVNRFLGGGTGGSVLMIAKDATVEDGKLVVNVYYDIIPWCDGLVGADERKDKEYCLKNNDGETLFDFVNRKKDSIPLSEMIFTKDGDHYVLESVQNNRQL